jgi:hypothetical protein
VDKTTVKEYSDFHKSVINYFKNSRNDAVQKKPKLNEKILQNSLIQNFIKRKLTKMIEISSPIRNKSTREMTSERNCDKENKNISVSPKFNLRRKISFKKKKYYEVKPITKMSIKRKQKFSDLDKMMNSYDLNITQDN